MNYLAHFYLSHHDPSLIVGNYIADDVKGKQYLEYPLEIQRGILLHRMIDDFTDGHELVQRSTKKVRPNQRKYAPVVIDLLYDHLLAKHWKNHANDELAHFTGEVYQILHDYEHLFPEQSKIRLNYMEKHNWLLNYKNYDGINRALNGLSKRTTFDNNMDRAAELLKIHESELKADFDQFLPEIRSFSKTQIKKGIILR